MLKSVGIRAIAVNFPETVRTNNYWRKHYPELVATAGQKSLAKNFSPKTSAKNNTSDLWKQEMKPYLSDPFRGAVERRILAPGESSLALQRDAAEVALKAANLSPQDIDLMLVTSMFPEQIVPGDAAFLAGELGLQGAAWNLESTCTSALVSLETACALMQTGRYRNVLVVVSCTYSRFVDPNDTLSFLVGDGAGAFIVSALDQNQGILGSKIIHTNPTCGAFFSEFAVDRAGTPRMFIRASQNAGKVFRNVFLNFLRDCCFGAIAEAGLNLEDIDFFVFNTLVPWYGSLFTRALGIDPKRTIDTNSLYGNIGVVSPVANLYHAAQSKKICKDDLILIYTFGATGSAGAIVVKWGEVALGAMPIAHPHYLRAA
ncbi:MAG: 3-oxoacyl-[acyl-carrier-protein] synthase III C-terminal domain-containing protein [Cyanobacteria bacterium P01_E01_bin.42]